MQGDVEARMNQVGDAAAVRAYVSEHLDQMLAELIGWVRLRSVAGLPEHQPDLQRSANSLPGALRDVGFPTTEVWETEGSPAVYAEWCQAPEAPTVLIYSHHDVRAAKDETWGQVPPFEPALRDGRLWGRGTSDAKGQVLAPPLSPGGCDEVSVIRPWWTVRFAAGNSSPALPCGPVAP